MPARNPDQMDRLTLACCDATSLEARSRRAGRLFAYLLADGGAADAAPRLSRWLSHFGEDPALAERFQESWGRLLRETHAVQLLADAGLPAQRGLPGEVVRRIFLRLLPGARAESDAGLLFGRIFSSRLAVDRFCALPAETFERLAALLWPATATQSELPVYGDLRHALRVLAARIAGRGAATAIRERGTPDIHDSPFYKLVFVTERFATAEESAAEQQQWRQCITRCRDELEQVHLHMEDAGVSSALVYDLLSIEAGLARMELIASVLVAADRTAPRDLLDTLVQARLDDTRLLHLFRQNLTLLARKTVERTGHSGEHYVARDRADYWQMWRAAAAVGC